MKLLAADESFEDEDLLEMANAGLISFIVVDEHKAAAWEPVFENVKLYHDIAVRTGEKIAWDPKKSELVNPSAEAKAMLTRKMRSPWTL